MKERTHWMMLNNFIKNSYIDHIKVTFRAWTHASFKIVNLFKIQTKLNLDQSVVVLTSGFQMKRRQKNSLRNYRHTIMIPLISLATICKFSSGP